MSRMTFTAEPAQTLLWPLNYVGGGLVTYTVPALLANRALTRPGTGSTVGAFELNCLAAFTLRLSRLHHDKRLYNALPSRSTRNPADWQLITTLKRRTLSLDVDNVLAIASLACGAGRSLRRELTWVGGRSHATAWLVPPPSSAIPGLISDLADFVAREVHEGDVTELAEAILYQFIHIHPLSDGNGRTVRALLAGLSLQRKAVDPLALVWLSLCDKRAIGDAWRAGQDASGGTAGADRSSLWSSATADCTAHLGALLAGATNESLRKAIEFSCSVGSFTTKDLCACLSIGNGLAQKIVLSMEELGWSEQEGVWANERLERLLFDGFSAFSQLIKEAKE